MIDRIKAPQKVDKSKFIGETDGLEVKYGLPKKVTYCKLCVISNQRPNSAVEYTHTKNTKKSTIHFDENGICDACNFAIQKNQL